MSQSQLGFPTTHVVAHCSVCGRKAISTTGPDYVHLACMAKPKPCECGQASMPHPLCTHCRGSGRINGELCPYCPPGPCVACCAKALISRIRDEKTTSPS